METSLILFGHKGCGKSYWGLKIATAWGWEFIDTDRLIEKEGGGLSCKEIALKEGLKRFREIEKRVILQLQKKERVVIAVGGGSVLDEEVREHLKGLGKMIYLKLPKEMIKKRVLSEGQLPSFLDPLNPEASFEKMYEARERVYASIEAICWKLPL